jgi:hypothetical protein
LNGGGATLLGPDAVGACAVPLFGPFFAPLFLVLDPVFGFDLLLGDFFAGGFFLAPELACWFSSATPGRGGVATLGFGAFEPLLPEEPVRPETPVELGEPDAPDEPDVPDEPVLLDEPGGLLCEPVEEPDGVEVEPVEVFSEAASGALPVGPDGPPVVEVGPVGPAVVEVASAAQAAPATGPHTPAAVKPPPASAQRIARRVRRVPLVRRDMRQRRSSNDLSIWGLQ